MSTLGNSLSMLTQSDVIQYLLKGTAFTLVISFFSVILGIIIPLVK